MAYIKDVAREAGVISFPSGAPADGYLRLQAAGVPVVLLNRRVPGLAAPLIRHDFTAGYAMAVEHLAARGHRRIGTVLSRSFATRVEQIAAWHAAIDELIDGHGDARSDQESVIGVRFVEPANDA